MPGVTLPQVTDKATGLSVCTLVLVGSRAGCDVWSLVFCLSVPLRNDLSAFQERCRPPSSESSLDSNSPPLTLTLRPRLSGIIYDSFRTYPYLLITTTVTPLPSRGLKPPPPPTHPLAPFTPSTCYNLAFPNATSV